MAKQTKEDKRIEAAVNDAFKRLGNNVQLSIFDVGKVLEAGRVAGRTGGDIDAAVSAALAHFRKN